MNVFSKRASAALTLALSTALVGWSALPATAGPLSYELLPGGNGIRIKGTGYNLTNPLPANNETAATGIDPIWTIKAFANNAVTSPNVYIPNAIPAGWYGTPANTANNAIIFAGDPNTYRWATYAAYPNSLGQPLVGTPRTQSYFGPGRSSLVNDSNYTYIVSTSFTLAKSSQYIFTYNTTADNRVQLYIGGCVTGSGTQTPGISVSAPCAANSYFIAENAANTTGLFGTLLSGSKSVYLNAGTYDLNYVVTDNFVTGSPGTFGQTGILIGASAFTEVPAPLPIVGAGVFFSYSRRMRRRIRVSKA